jgi:hypothetical protein
METRTKKDDMRRMHKYLGSLLLGVVLIAPVGLQAGNNCRDDSRQDAREWFAPPGNNRSGSGGNQAVGAFGVKGPWRLREHASV